MSDYKEMLGEEIWCTEKEAKDTKKNLTDVTKADEKTEEADTIWRTRYKGHDMDTCGGKKKNLHHSKSQQKAWHAIKFMH